MIPYQLYTTYESNRDRRKRYSNENHKYHDPGVLIGNWFEDRARIEAETEDILHKFSKNGLAFQILDKYVSFLSKPIHLTRNTDGFLHHGDIVRLKWTDEKNGVFYLAALPLKLENDGSFGEPCLALGTRDSKITERSAFHIFRNNNDISNQVPLMYDERVLICTTEITGRRILNCEPKTFFKFAKQSGHQEVTWVRELSSRGLWKVLHVEKNKRLWTRGQYIPVNTNIVICHLSTGQRLALERETSISTSFGKEKEVSGHSYEDNHKTEGIENVWQFEAPLIKEEEYGQPMNIPQCTL
ncbi:cilia- and flagella-associated protein 161-like [Stegodyphus dumicola]|uniref:cilia- and flagella-associated protein 161-like n=1 Tax=Stegodyphus dumicola TaxID=202533 RepID=UPI0015A788C0|nr:cilia- and flagella-associated protein 161-like [Stegodyphus dumicola]